MSGISSIATVINPREDRRIAQASLAELDKNDKTDPSTLRSFQYFPETISDGRSVEYMTKNGIGSSHPLYQWLHGSARTISFEATFTSEEAPSPNGSDITGNITDAGAAISGAIKNPISTAISAAKGPTGASRYTVNVAAAIAWLRGKTYPSYIKNIALAPPKLMLYLPNSGITSGASGQGSKDFPISGSVPCIMLRCDVSYEAFFRTGEPRIATVSLEFAEIIQLGRAWKYVDRSTIDAQWNKGQYYTKDDNYAGSSAGPVNQNSALYKLKKTFGG